MDFGLLLRGTVLLSVVAGVNQWLVHMTIHWRRLSVQEVGDVYIITSASCIAMSTDVRLIYEYLCWFEQRCGIQVVALVDAACLRDELNHFHRMASRWASGVTTMVALCVLVHWIGEQQILLAALGSATFVANGMFIFAIIAASIPSDVVRTPTQRYVVAPARDLARLDVHPMKNKAALLVCSVEFSDAYILMRTMTLPTVPGKPLHTEPSGSSTSCVICFDYARTYACRVCGNLGFCSTCVPKFESCPLCKAAGGFIRIFHP